ncbi:MAG: hypothetical protein GTN81_10220 [Proteobacteria bacterium]|nr:hypothetical protein [Pseudomonadota bacterium]
MELRTEFPGIGGTIITHEAVACALREEYSPSPKSAHRLFLRDTILKKLEDYFHRRGFGVGETVEVHMGRGTDFLTSIYGGVHHFRWAEDGEEPETWILCGQTSWRFRWEEP